MKRIHHLLLIALVILSSFTIGFLIGNQNIQKADMDIIIPPTPVELKTQDGLLIKGDYYESFGDEGVILLHSTNKDRHAYYNLTEYLVRAGYAVLAIDLRGFGDSKNNVNYSPQAYKEMVYDVKSGVDFLLEEKQLSNVSLIGSSIGAAVAIKYAANDPSRIRRVVLISPFGYSNGINVTNKVLNYTKPVLFIASSQDPRSGEQTILLYNTSKSVRKYLSYNNSTHHAEMIVESDPVFDSEIVSFLNAELVTYFQEEEQFKCGDVITIKGF